MTSVRVSPYVTNTVRAINTHDINRQKTLGKTMDALEAEQVPTILFSFS